MRPIDVPSAGTTYIGPPGVGDLPVEVVPELDPQTGVIQRVNRSRWRPDETERMAIALGGDVVLDVFGPSHPVVRVLATDLPVLSPAKVYATFDATLARGIAWSLSANLRELGIDVSLEDAIGWTDEKRAELAEWMAGFPADEAAIPPWLETRPEWLR